MPSVPSQRPEGSSRSVNCQAKYSHIVSSSKAVRKPASYAMPVPYSQAVEIFGSEQELKSIAKRASRLSNWKSRGVPAGIVLSVVLQRSRLKTEKKGNDDVISLPDFFGSPDVSDRVARLSQHHRKQFQERFEEILGRVRRELAEFLRVLESDYQRESSGRPKRRAIK